MSQYKVHNLMQGGSPVPAGYTSWIDYWVKATNMKATWCQNVSCPGSILAMASDGVHVQLDAEYNDRRWWIVPLCHKCNTQFGAHMTVNGPLVSATDPKVIRW